MGLFTNVFKSLLKKMKRASCLHFFSAYERRYHMYNTILRVLPIIYMILVWIQSSYFNPEVIEPIASKVSYEMIIIFGVALELFHFIQFGILYLLWIIAFLTFRDLNPKIEFVVLLFSIGYGVIDEIHQLFVPFRSFSVTDLIKNFIGVWGAWFLVHKKYYYKKHSTVGIILRGISSLSDRNE